MRMIVLWLAVLLLPGVVHVSNAQMQDGHSEAVDKIIEFLQSGSFDQASAPIERYLSERAQAVGPNSTMLARSILNLGDMCFHYGGYRLAESLYLRAIDIYSRADPDGSAVLVGKIDLGVIYLGMGALDKARRYFVEALGARSTEFDELTGAAANGLAGVARAETNYAEAERLYRKALTIADRVLPKDDPTRVIPLGNLADLYSEMGDYARAEPVFLQAISLLNHLPHGEPALTGQRTLIANLVGLAAVYDAKGDVPRALPLVRRAIVLARSGSNPNHPEVGRAMAIASILAIHRRDYAEAETLAQLAMGIAERVYGPVHPNSSVALGNLAYIYELEGKYREAESLARRALEIVRHSWGENHPETARSLNNLALVCERLGKLDEADDLLRRSIVINEKTLGSAHPHTALGFDNLANLLWARGSFADAQNAFGRALAIQDRNLALIVTTGSEAQKRAYTAMLRPSTERILNFQELSQAGVPARRLAATTVLRRKAKVLEALAGEVEALRRGLGPRERAWFDQLLVLRRREAALAAHRPPGQSPAEYQVAIQALQKEDDELDQKIANGNAGFRKASEPISLEDVQAKLGAQSALIEFIWYRAYDPGNGLMPPRRGDPKYGAFVILDAGNPVWVDLGAASQIDAAVFRFQRDLQLRRAIGQTSQDIDKLTMARIRPFLKDRTQLWISPDGELNIVPFAAFQDEKKHYCQGRSESFPPRRSKRGPRWGDAERRTQSC